MNISRRGFLGTVAALFAGSKMLPAAKAQEPVRKLRSTRIKCEQVIPWKPVRDTTKMERE